MKFTVPISSVIELVGLAALVFGAYLFDWRAAVIVGGLVLLVVGLALDRPDQPDTPGGSSQ